VELGVREPSLDDVFLALTGRPTGDGDADAHAHAHADSEATSDIQARGAA